MERHVGADPGSGTINRIDLADWGAHVLVNCGSLPSPYFGSSCSRPASAPGGRWVVYSLSLGVSGSNPRQGVFLMDSACSSLTPSCFELSSGPFRFRWPYAWSPDGTQLAAVPGPSGAGIGIFDPTTGNWSGSVPNTDYLQSADGIAWSPDGLSLALSLGPDLWVTSVATGNDILEHYDQSMVSVEFSLLVPP
jgi:Tol biopolymer transport system component